MLPTPEVHDAPRTATVAGSPHVDSASLRFVRIKLRALIAAVLKLPLTHPDVDDALQESLRRVLQSPPPSTVPFDRWAIGVARHVAIDRIREKQRDRRHFAPMGEEGSPALQVASSEESPIEVLTSNEDVERFRAAVQSLPDGQRKAIELFHYEGLSYEEIGVRMSVPKGTVAIWLMRAKSTLQQALVEKKS